MLKNKIKLILVYMKRDFQEWFRYKASILNDLITILTSGVVYALIALEYPSEDLSLSQFIIFGSIFNYIFINTVIASYTAISKAYWDKKLELLISSSFPVELYCLSISLSRYIKSVLYGVIFLFFSSVMFQVKLTLFHSDYILLSFLLIIAFFCATGIGFLSASTFLGLNAKAGDDPVQYFLFTVGSLITGVYIPLKLFPEIIQMLSLFFPQTIFYSIFRRLFLPTNNLILFNIVDIFSVLFFLTFQTLVWYILGKKALLLSINHAKKRGELVLWT